MKRCRNLLVTLICATLFLSACTIGGVPFENVKNLKNDEAVVYIYRPRALVGGGVLYDVSVNGEKLVTLVHTSYYPYVAPAGESLFTVKTVVHGNQASLNLTTEPGETYYIRGGTNMTAPGVHQPTLTLVPAVVGTAEVRKCVKY